MLLLQGRSEFLEKYQETAQYFLGLGYAVAAVDWRGQGGSPRQVPGTMRGHIDDYAHYLADLDAFLAWAKARRLPDPWHFVAHSMGGQIALRWLVRQALAGAGPSPVASLALVAPMLSIAYSGMSRHLVDPLLHMARTLRLGRHYAPGQGDFGRRIYPFDNNPFTSGAERYRLWQDVHRRHPQRCIGGPTWGWLAASQRSMMALLAPGGLEALDLPVLFLLAERDRVVGNAASRQAASRLPRAELTEIAGARHDLFWEAEEIRQDVLARIAAFLEKTPR